VPAAVVEEVSGTPPGVEFMDYVAAGKVIKLGPRDTIVLGYLKSCWRETITGGTVTVGAEQSTLVGGKIERAQVQCGGGQMQLASEQAVQSAGYVSREIAKPNARPKPQRPRAFLYSRLPIIELGGPGKLLIERIDAPSEKYEIVVGPRDLVRGSFFDFARARRILSAGGLYLATFGAKQIVFKVDDTAPAAAPVVARLLRF
jgi:hypothetical protein